MGQRYGIICFEISGRWKAGGTEISDMRARSTSWMYGQLEAASGYMYKSG
jgi:hypothetical protein